MSWLISKAMMDKYGNSLSSPEREAESSADISSDGEQYAPSKLSPMQRVYLSPDKMTAFSRLSRFGMMSVLLTADRGEAVLTSYLAASPARTSASPEKGKGLKANDQACGAKWRESLARYDRDTSSWKTPQCSLFGGGQESLATLPKWGMTVDGELYQLPTPVRRTKGSVFGFMVPTPVKSDGTSGAVIGKDDTFYQTGTGMPRKVNRHGTNGSVGLSRLVKMWPTPRKSDSSGAASTRIKAAHGLNDKSFQLREAVYDTPEKAGGALNPTWVEWLMGWPLGWTDLQPLGMDKSPLASDSRGKSCLENFHKWLDAHRRI